jgi:hypothetical protein
MEIKVRAVAPGVLSGVPQMQKSTWIATVMYWDGIISGLVLLPNGLFAWAQMFNEWGHVQRMYTLHPVSDDEMVAMFEEIESGVFRGSVRKVTGETFANRLPIGWRARFISPHGQRARSLRYWESRMVESELSWIV